ncbi:MAG TPA: pentapeptide repeat-containing protein [Tepidisphaeraceae bacterium]|nr:pentapeptide repeat-containing protein [Tepidisphaeraceae bacterium]
MESGKPSQSPSSYAPPTTAEELLRRYAVGERYFCGAEIEDCACFRGAVLVDAMLDGAWLFDADFRNADLRRVRFNGSNVKCANFADADLGGASFREAAVDGATFTGAKLTGASFEGAGWYGCTIHDGMGFPTGADFHPAPRNSDLSESN